MTLEQLRTLLIRTSSELINANEQAFYDWQGNKLGNDLFIEDPDRASRIYDAASEGADGSTHAENIEDFREYAKAYYDALSRDVEHAELSDEDAALFETEMEEASDALDMDLDRLEQWHAENGSLHEQVG